MGDTEGLEKFACMHMKYTFLKQLHNQVTVHTITCVSIGPEFSVLLYQPALEL